MHSIYFLIGTFSRFQIDLSNDHDIEMALDMFFSSHLDFFR